MNSRGLAVLLVAVFLLPLLPATGAQNPIFGVNLSCEDPAEMDVSPSGYEPVEMVCTYRKYCNYRGHKSRNYQ